jgi:hypothetical protein
MGVSDIRSEKPFLLVELGPRLRGDDGSSLGPRLRGDDGMNAGTTA